MTHRLTVTLPIREDSLCHNHSAWVVDKDGDTIELGEGPTPEAARANLQERMAAWFGPAATVTLPPNPGLNGQKEVAL